jgi:hypothetical protein
MSDSFQKLDHTILATISSSRSRFVGDPSQFVIDPSSPDWGRSGLRIPSVIQCEFLTAVHKRLVQRKVGELSAAAMQQTDECLKAAHGIA